jgi:hypothetical protein
MDRDTVPLKVSFSKARTRVDFKQFKPGDEFYHTKIASIYENDLLYEYERDPLYTGDYVYENDLLIDVVYDGNVSLLDQTIESDKLRHFTSLELRLLRNMIFAKYNYRFNSKDLQDYFSQFLWYTGAEPYVQRYMSALDWRNIGLIQEFEKSLDGSIDKSPLGETLAFTGQLCRFEYPEMDWAIIKKIKFDGEIVLRDYTTGKQETARTDVRDSQFQFELGAIPPELLGRWVERNYYAGNYQCSDQELQVFSLDFRFYGTYTDLYGVEQPVRDIYIQEGGKGYYDGYYYMYADRDVVIQGVMDGEDGYTNGLVFRYPKAALKSVYSLSLKRGWNKLKSSIIYNGKYIIQKTESSSENGFYKSHISW